MIKNEIYLNQLSSKSYVWLITGVAGFIGSNLLEYLLRNDQKVIGIDNFSTGYSHNLTEVQNSTKDEQWANFQFIRGDICNQEVCYRALRGFETKLNKYNYKKVDFVLHQAALGSVPRSLENPINTNNVNISGFLNILDASRKAQVKNFVYAASSSTYGDSKSLPKVEEVIGNPLSPYALTKLVNEMYAEVYSKVYNFNSIGLRYFNVFGSRQDPNGAYAAVIPKWIKSLLTNEELIIYGDGTSSRDFCYISNVIQANLLAALLPQKKRTTSQIFNIACGEKTTLLTLYQLLLETIKSKKKIQNLPNVKHLDFRKGDILHSLADITKARDILGYKPQYNVRAGLINSIEWYLKYFKES